MRIKIPFTRRTLAIGRKEAEASRQSVMYGSWFNTFADIVRNGGVRIDFDTLYTIYNNVVDVKQAIRKIQNAVLKGGWTLLNVNDQTKLPNAGQVAIANQFLDSSGFPFSVLKDLWVRDLDVAGNSYWLIRKNAGGGFLDLQPIDPRTMTIVSDKYGNVMKYIQSVFGSESQEFDPEEVIHSVMDYSTKNPMFGVSPIEAIVWEAKTEMSAQMSNFFFFENNAVPAHLLILEENLSDDQMKQLKDSLDDRFKGTKNRWKTGAIPFVKDIKAISPSQKDMQYIQGRAFSTKKVVVAFGVDAFILGYTEGIQRGNADVIYTEFYENTVRPYEQLFEETINSVLFPRLGLNEIKFVINQAKYNNDEVIANRTRQDVLSGIMTINEARQLRNLEPSDNELADELLFGGMLIDDLGEEVKEIAEEVKKKNDLRFKGIHNLLNE